MDSTTHQFAECVEHHAVPLDRRFSGKRVGDDEQSVVAAALACAGVSGMQGRVVDDFQPNRLEFGQPLVEQGFDVVGQVQAGAPS